MVVNWQGVFPAASTQFNQDYSLNVPGTLAHIDAMLQAGIHGLVMMGSVGENTTLDLAEKKELLRATIAHVGRRAPILVGVAEYTTSGACRWAGLEADSGDVLLGLVEPAQGRVQAGVPPAGEVQGHGTPLLVESIPPHY